MLLRAGEDERRRRLDRGDLPHQREAGFSRVLDTRRSSVGNDDGGRSGGTVQRLRRNQAGAEAFDRRRLEDVERLSLRNAAVRIDQADLGDAVAQRQLLRQRPAERTASDDRDEGHEALFYRDDDINRHLTPCAQPS